MLKNFDDAQKFGKENMDLALKSFGAVSKSMQAIAVEVADYSKKSFEDSTAAMEKLMGAKTLEKAIEVQSDYFKSAYEGFVSKAEASTLRQRADVSQRDTQARPNAGLFCDGRRSVSDICAPASIRWCAEFIHRSLEDPRSRDDAAILARMPQHGLDIRRSSPILETENTVAYYLRTNVHGIAA